MARNLRSKLSSSDKLVIYDVNTEGTAKFAKENEGVEVANSVREVAEKSVRNVLASHSILHDDFCSIYDLSWGHFLCLFF